MIKFIKRAENLDYPSAVEFLAQRVGITIQHEDKRERNELVNRRRIYEMNIHAERFLRICLFDQKL